MAKKFDIDDLVGAHEMAQRLGIVRQQVVQEWRHRHADFPEPIAALTKALI